MGWKGALKVLEPRERMLLLESLRPPEGYALSAAIGTSFTLDLMALLCAPLAFTWFDSEDEEGRPSSEPVALLEAVRRHARRIHVFCQAGMTTLPPTGKPLLVYLEPCVVEVAPPAPGGVFHPKVWVLRYEARDLPIRYRVLCLTRNLTFDRSWDTCLVLEGALGDRVRAHARNHPLADFVAGLPLMAVRKPVSAEALASVELMQDELRRVDFEVPLGLDDDLTIHPVGSPGQRAWPFPKQVPENRRLLVVSPFLTPGCLRKLAKTFPVVDVLSRPEALARLPVAVRESLGRLLVLTPGSDPETEDDGDIHTGLEGLHAKLYVMDDGWKARFWTGSANATTAAFEGNVEFLVELAGPKKDWGIDTLIDREVGGLGGLLQSYEGPFEEPNEAAQLKEALEEELEIWARRASLLPLHARAERAQREADDGPAQTSWNLFLENRGSMEPWPEDLEMRVWPATLPRDRAIATRLEPGVVASFPRLPVGMLTTFFAVELSLRRQGCHAVCQRVLNLPLSGAPDDRPQRVLRDLLQTPEQLLRLLWLLLGHDAPDAADFVEGLGVADGSSGWRAGPGGFPLLERLLETLARDPRSLDEVRRLLEDLEKTPEGRELVPDALRAIWPAIDAVQAERAR